MKNIFFNSLHYLGILSLAVFALLFYSCDKKEDIIHFDDEIIVSIQELKEFYKGEDIILNQKNNFDKIYISGVVVSSYNSGNLPIENAVVIQEGQTGIILLPDEKATNVKLGDSVQINIETGTLSAVDGNINVKGIKTQDFDVLKENTLLKPRSVALAELNSNPSSYLGSLVKVIGAEVQHYKNGDVFLGEKELDDGTGGTLILNTKKTASFAESSIPSFGTFSGIVTLGSDLSTLNLWMRNEDDLEEYIPSLYPEGFPEKFDTDLVKDAYARADLELNSGNWIFDGVTLVTKTDLRPINEDGTKGVQFNQKNAVPLYLEMNFDVYRGASKVTILHGSYGPDPQCTWRLEYSTDEGDSWQQVGDDVTSDNKDPKTAEFEMDIKGKVRFRVHKLALGDENNGRLNLDDFNIYNN